MRARYELLLFVIVGRGLWSQRMNVGQGPGAGLTQVWQGPWTALLSILR